ncbi:MAG: hypothetical protein Q4A84_00470 [Neisseria sp.]|uniref:hypothetical protein n=1 Tax=Neisseria sp. TaxID=192066 RepID=UPI0026DBA54A|nr:hypothetical protein [Neisseria sp.]MDO4640169.1 hypothetical protein [Neisseria sp.]
MKKTLLAALPVFLLAACSGNENQASESALKDGIESFAAEQGVCTPLPLAILDVAGQPVRNNLVGEPKLSIADRNSEGKRINKEAMEQMEILTDAGIYRKADKKSVEQGDTEIKTVSYQLTEKGAAMLRFNSQGPVVCTGSLKVKKINWFTEPTPSNGMTVSKVSYQAELVPEKWMKKLLKSNENFEKQLTEPQEYTATMVKTNNGWHDIRELH